MTGSQDVNRLTTLAERLRALATTVRHGAQLLRSLGDQSLAAQQDARADAVEQALALGVRVQALLASLADDPDEYDVKVGRVREALCGPVPPERAGG
jgi:hypothetical protein